MATTKSNPTAADLSRWQKYNELICGHPRNHKSPAVAIACRDNELEQMYLLGGPATIK